jgi:hypothetical protein
MRYRLRETDLSGDGVRRLMVGEALPQENIDLYARGGWRAQPAVMVEYGLYSTLADGTLSLMPQGGLVLQLGAHWQAGGSAARRVYDESSGARRDFVPTFFDDAALDEQPERGSYRVFVARQAGDDSALELSARHRELGETIRLFFSDDVLNHLESLYLVPGDEIDEAELKLTRRIAPEVLATFGSTVANGGGGHFQARKAAPFENRVRYVVTSLDTQFERTATGVFVAFHRLEQQLRSTSPAQLQTAPEARFERLQVLLTQDLDLLVDLAADWAVQLDLELSRGALPSSALAEDALRKQVMGGFSVSF